MKSLLYVLLMLGPFNLIGMNGCPDRTKDEQIDFADIIFLGRVIGATDTSYVIKVLESFKGVHGDTLNGILTSEVRIPEIGTTWLIYARSLSEINFFADICSGSKSFEWPHSFSDVSFPMPPRRGAVISSGEELIQDELIKDMALNELYYEISSLRSHKSMDDLKIMQNKFNGLEDTISRLNVQSIILKWLIILVVVLLLSSLFFTLQNKLGDH